MTSHDTLAGVPAVVRSKALAAGAGQWLRDLPELAAQLERDWSISVGQPYPGGTESFVARATLADGTPAVLKLLIPQAGPGGPASDQAQHEITVLRLADGDGCARLLRADATRGALLLERLGRSLFQLALPIAQRQEILCAAASRIWRPAPGCGLPTGADKGHWLARFITSTWEELGRPVPERVIAHALGCAARRGRRA